MNDNYRYINIMVFLLVTLSSYGFARNIGNLSNSYRVFYASRNFFCPINSTRICRKFEYIKEKAENIPKTTEELFSLSALMEEVRTKKIAPLRQRVQVSKWVIPSDCPATPLK